MTKELTKKTYFFKSRSGNEVYKTERHRNGSVTCFCPGYVYNQKCWHTEQAKTEWNKK